MRGVADFRGTAPRPIDKRIADDLHDQLQVRREDVVINLVEVVKENWSFGGGIAQYAS